MTPIHEHTEITGAIRYRRTQSVLNLDQNTVDAFLIKLFTLNWKHAGSSAPNLKVPTNEINSASRGTSASQDLFVN